MKEWVRARELGLLLLGAGAGLILFALAPSAALPPTKAPLGTPPLAIAAARAFLQRNRIPAGPEIVSEAFANQTLLRRSQQTGSDQNGAWRWEIDLGTNPNGRPLLVTLVEVLT